MKFLKMFLSQENSSYNLTMIIIYIVVIIAAFGLCVIVSHKLKVYSPKIGKTVNNTVSTEN